MSIQHSLLFGSWAALLLLGLAGGCSGESTEGSSSGKGGSSSGTASGTSSSSSGTASGGSSSSSSMAGVGGASSSSGAGGGCAHCSEALMTGDASNLCPASQVLYDTLQGCRCGVLCATDCMVPCGGGADNPTCLSCVNAQCHNEAAACVADM